MTDERTARVARVGLCVSCEHSRTIASGKATKSEFWLCQRSASDPRFAKYPALPVRACSGHTLRAS